MCPVFIDLGFVNISCSDLFLPSVNRSVVFVIHLWTEQVVFSDSKPAPMSVCSRNIHHRQSRL